MREGLLSQVLFAKEQMDRAEGRMKENGVVKEAVSKKCETGAG